MTATIVRRGIATGTASIFPLTKDANAFVLAIIFPEGGDPDVPVLVVGDITADKDLGFFDGVTEPGIAIINDAGDAYVKLDAGDDMVAGSKGLHFVPAVDEDVEIINVAVGGGPRWYWDESEDAFHSTAELVLDDNLTISSSGSLIFAEALTPGAQFDAVIATDQLMLSVGSAYGTQFILTHFDNRGGEHGHADQTNPTYYVHSATSVASETDEWISFTHDVTDGVIGTGSGGIKYELGTVGVPSYAIKTVKVTKAFSSDLFDADATTDSADVWLQPANTILLSAFMRLETQFAGPLHSDLDVTVGLAGDNDGLLEPAAMNMTSDAENTEYSGPGAYWNTVQVVTISTQQWVAYATSVGDNLGDLTAGTMDFYFTYIEF